MNKTMGLAIPAKIGSDMAINARLEQTSKADLARQTQCYKGGEKR